MPTHLDSSAPVDLVLACCLLLGAVSGSYAALSLQGLHADGAYYLLKILLDHNFTFAWEIPRTSSHILQQWLTLSALHLGQLDTATLARIHGATMILTPIALIGLSYLFLPRDWKQLFVFPVFYYLSALMASVFSPIGEAQLASAYFWPLLYAILFVAPRPGGRVLLVAMILPIFFFHESYVLIAPLLVLAALLRLIRSEDQSDRRFFAILALLLVAVIIVVLLFVIMPKSDEYAARSASYLETIRSLAFLHQYGSFNLPALLGIFAGVVLCIAAIPMITSSPKTQWVLLITMALAAFATVLAPMLSEGALSAKLQFDARSYGPVLIPVLVLVLAFASFYRQAARRYLRSRFIAAILLLLALGQVGWHAIATTQWRAYLDDFRAILDGHQGLIGHEQALATLQPHARARFEKMSWVWTYPTMSILLAPDGRILSMIANPIRKDSRWQPFDPETLTPTLLASDRFDFSAYLASLEMRKEPR